MSETARKITGPQLLESEARFREMLGRLATASVNARQLRGQVEKLETENKVLGEGLEKLRSDYETLEKSFLQLKIKLDAGLDMSAADKELKADNNALKEELRLIRSDYEAMEQSFTLLKTQFLDARNREPASSVEAMQRLKAGIAGQIDGTIGRLEAILEAADAQG